MKEIFTKVMNPNAVNPLVEVSEFHIHYDPK